MLKRTFEAHQRLLRVEAIVDHFDKAQQLHVVKAALLLVKTVI